MTNYIHPTAFEVATSSVLGLTAAQPLPAETRGPIRALGDVMLPFLAEGPCYVTFSGGRDSSAVLAVATDVARREGLPLPVPVTRTYPAYPESEESAWQELVVDHLGLSDWVRVAYDREHELLGGAAQRSLRRRGLLWTPQLQIHSHVYNSLGGGSLLTGEGGDATLGARRATAIARFVTRRPTSKGTRRAVEAVLPTPLRRAAIRRQSRTHDRPWLRPDTLRRHQQLLSREIATEPLRFDAATWWHRRRRFWTDFEHNHALVAADHGLKAANPLLHPTFLAALAQRGGRLGFTSRTAAMETLFAGLLPRELLRRSQKASFNQAYTGSSFRDFAEGWDGRGVDTDLVDVDRLRAHWLSDTPDTTTSMLLHSAWLAQEDRSTPGRRGHAFTTDG